MTKIDPKQWATMSPAQKFANLPEKKQEEILGGTDIAELEHVWDEWWARPNQVIPEEPYYPIHLLLTGRGWGKALALDTPLPTPTGWTTMGEVKEGDTLYDEEGEPCTVLKVHDIFTPEEGNMFRVTTDGGNTIDACGDHQWAVMDNRFMQSLRFYHYNHRYNISLSDVIWTETPVGNMRARVVDTREMYENQKYESEGLTAEQRSNFYIGRTKALRGSYVTPPEPEYTLGAVIAAYEEDELPWDMLRSLPSQRWEMLQGISDIYGEVYKRGKRAESIRFNRKFGPMTKKFVYELITSLGFEVRTDRPTIEAWSDYIEWFPYAINPFRHSVNKYLATIPPERPFRSFAHTVKKVEKIDPVPVRCITVDSPHSLFLAGRMMLPTHNTRTMSEWIRRQAINYPGCRIGILGRTAADVRDIMALGDSGVLNVGPEEEKPEFKPSQRKLEWPNGSVATMFSAETPDQLRGQQFHFFACDELAAYTQFVGVDGLTAFENMRIATRLGEKPYGVVATTPKRTDVIRDLLEEAKEGKVRVVRGSTKENASLSSAYKDIIFGQFAGTALAKQELEGEMLDDFPEGALWTEDMFEKSRIMTQTPPACSGGIIVSVDPSVSDSPKDECGIVVIGFTGERRLHKRQAFVLEDASLMAKPEEWAQRVVEVSNKWGASAVIVETNQGRALLNNLLLSINPNLRIIGVNASQGKKLRAEPVVLPYEQGRVHHYGKLATLESQMTTWEPEHSKKSPDRLDALVHGITAVLIDPPPDLPVARVRSISPASRKMNITKGAGQFRRSPRQMTMRRSR